MTTTTETRAAFVWGVTHALAFLIGLGLGVGAVLWLIFG